MISTTRIGKRRVYRENVIMIMKSCDNTEDQIVQMEVLKTLGKTLGKGYKRRESVRNNPRYPYAVLMYVRHIDSMAKMSLIGLGYKVSVVKTPRNLTHKNW